MLKRRITLSIKDEGSRRGRDSTKFFRLFLKNINPGELHFTIFSPEKLARLFLLKEVNPSPDCKMIQLLKLDNFFSQQTVVE